MTSLGYCDVMNVLNGSNSFYSYGFMDFFCPFFSLQASQLAIILCPTQALFFYFLHPSSIVGVRPVSQVRVRPTNSGWSAQSEPRPLPDPWWQRTNPSQHLKSPSRSRTRWLLKLDRGDGGTVTGGAPLVAICLVCRQMHQPWWQLFLLLLVLKNETRLKLLFL